ncbi:7-carboxy-7-deazaguanine synthase QueE [Roseibacillus persicicus]|uniref:7-carboxy-7-deazaguanine synthase QueE n=1 Tax=Roseibacillus persicicus TaxID=454148 RepID=UPI00280D630E|nr:7-carboxy-7-deazaguanine synthase QueE [Roseibacillus persicicus]MDQ8189971.1 7-carboxy-7-deazaguanine synthase QueE [Roseibacillus persicicus]
MKLARLPDGSPEVFRTLQGEGPSMGCPAVFLRLSLCNLHCVWCDTPFTWNWEGTPWPHLDERKFSKSDYIVEKTPAELTATLESASRPGDRLVITGGEPLLQQNELAVLVTRLPENFSAIEIETNGTQLPLSALDSHIAQYNVSPKLANSQNAPELRIQEKAMKFFATCERAFFKFVVVSQSDLKEVEELQQRFEIPASRILLMPEGRSAEALAKSRSWLAQECLDHGYRLTDRLHVQLWGDERAK